MILYIKHIDIEGPGTIETFFEKQGFPSRTIDVSRGETFPTDLSKIDAVIVLGGPMNVYEEDQYPFLKDEDQFIKKVMQAEVPLLGICLGSQLIAKACGAKVTKSPVKEVGWFKVALKETDQKDSLFYGLPTSLDVFHWHEDTFEIPQQAQQIATVVAKNNEPVCANQALRVGKNTFGIQFHVEVTEGIIADWCKNYLKSEDPTKREQAKRMLDVYAEKKVEFDQQSERMYRNFMRLIKK